MRYSELFNQAGDEKCMVTIVSKFSPLNCCCSGEANLDGSGRLVIKHIDMSPPGVFGLSNGGRI